MAGVCKTTKKEESSLLNMKRRGPASKTEHQGSKKEGDRTDQGEKKALSAGKEGVG